MAFSKIVLNAIDKEIKDYSKKIEKLMKQEVHVKTGALRDSIKTEQKSSSHFLVGVDVSVLKSDERNIGKIDYSIFYHDGHKAYTIRPKNAKALRWVGSDGQVHFAKSVRIPASRGDRFIDRVMDKRPKI